MSFSPANSRTPQAVAVAITDDTVSIDLLDGRTLSVPIAWYPRLAHGTSTERANWRLIGRGEGIHWPDLDEDLSIDSLLAGRASQESQSSLDKWLQARKAAG
jgi:hypothetical protein